MHVLILPSYYPEKHSPNNGLFFKSQAKAMLNSVDKLTVIYVEQKSLRHLFRHFKENLYQKSVGIEDGVLTYRIHGLSFLNQFEAGGNIWIYVMCKLIRDYIKDNGKPDVIHAHNVFNAGRVALLIKKQYGIPYIITEHSSSFLLSSDIDPHKRKIFKKVFFESKSIFAVSNALSEAMKKQVGIFPIQVVPNAVDTNLFRPPLVKTNDKFTFISVGHLMKNKGQMILLEAFRETFYLNEEVRLMICGDGADFIQLNDYIKRYNLSHKVNLYGEIEPEELVKLYHQADCLVSSSYKETFGVVIIEAMACGLPVIATKSGGPEDILNVNNGILIDTGSVSDLANAMRFVYMNKTKFDSDLIVKMIKERFSYPAVAKQIVKNYH